MKKNITINLFGTLYNIDEDAYQLLDSYLKSMKRYFGDKDASAEVANDIEHRVAELLWEKKEQGMEAVNIDIIKQIIGIIGDAEEIAGAEKGEGSEDNGDASNTTSGVGSTMAGDTQWDKIKQHFRYRRLYRDSRDSILAGVCSGLSYYFGFGDPVLWRLILILLIIFGNGIGVVMYVILWIIVPVARTPEDRLRMKGVQPTPESINQQIFTDHGTASNADTNNVRNSAGSGCLKGAFGCLLLFLLFPLLIMVLAFGIGVTGVLGAMSGLVGAFFGDDLAFLSSVTADTSWLMLSGIVSVIVALVIPIVSFLRWLAGSNHSTSAMTKYSLIILEILCILWAAWSISRSIARIHSISEDYYDTYHTWPLSPKSQLHFDGPYLKKYGFVVLSNNTNRCTWSGDYPTGEADRRYLDARETADELIFTAEKTDTVQPGKYDLYALARAEDSGAVIYASSNGQKKKTQAIPACGNQGGSLWQWACGNATIENMERAYPHLCSDSARQQIASAYGMEGLGWSVVCIKDIIVGKDSIVSYGVSTEESISQVPAECDWVSATDFVLLPRK